MNLVGLTIIGILFATVQDFIFYLNRKTQKFERSKKELKYALKKHKIEKELRDDVIKYYSLNFKQKSNIQEEKSF